MHIVTSLAPKQWSGSEWLHRELVRREGRVCFLVRLSAQIDLDNKTAVYYTVEEK
jgi:hypothetical protein